MKNDILSLRQIALLSAIGQDASLSKTFYLTGGTPLAVFYLQHRYSEDLDFFSETEFDLLPLNIFFKEQKRQIDFKSIDFQQSFNRNLFFLDFGEEVLKLEFTFFPFSRISKGREEYGLRVDSLEDIAVNKLFTIYQRSKARDYIDLYFICAQNKVAVSDLITKAKIKFDWHIDPIQLASQFVKAGQVKDFPRMIKPIANSAWQEFFELEAKKLKPEIFSK